MIEIRTCSAVRPCLSGHALNRSLSALGVDGRRWDDLRAPGELVALYDSSRLGPNRSGTGEEACDPPRPPDGNQSDLADGHVAAPGTRPRYQVEWNWSAGTPSADR